MPFCSSSNERNTDRDEEAGCERRKARLMPCLSCLGEQMGRADVDPRAARACEEQAERRIWKVCDKGIGQDLAERGSYAKAAARSRKTTIEKA